MLKFLKKNETLLKRVLFISIISQIVIFFKFYNATCTDLKNIIKTGYGLGATLFINILIIFGITLIKNKYIRNIIRSFYIGILSILTIIELLLLFNFATIIDRSSVNIFMQTNSNEAFEFIELYLNKHLISVTLIVLLTYLIDRFILKKIKIMNLKSNNIISYLFMFSVILSLVINIHIHYTGTKNIYGNILTRIYGITKIVIRDITESINIENMLKKEKIILTKNESEIQNIIFILGESTSKNRMSLYNYKKDTNPLLKKLEIEGNLYKYVDVISPHSHTIPTIEKLFTYKNYENNLKWYESDNLIDIMKTAGYKTQWISNQESSGIYGNIPATIGKRSDKLIFNTLKSSSDFDEPKNFDEELIPKFDLFKNKSFSVIHLMGTHSGYKNRYPKTWNKFDTNNLSGKEKIKAEYDNAVLYNDYVVSEIYNKVKDEEAIILYISDHGEEVYDFRDFVGHTESKGSRYMCEIPFMFIATDKFKEKYPNKIEKIQNSLNNPYMIDDLIFTILDLAGIETKEYDKTRSVINKEFNSQRKRIYSNKDYDTEFRNKN